MIVPLLMLGGLFIGAAMAQQKKENIRAITPGPLPPGSVWDPFGIPGWPTSQPQSSSAFHVAPPYPGAPPQPGEQILMPGGRTWSVPPNEPAPRMPWFNPTTGTTEWLPAPLPPPNAEQQWGPPASWPFPSYPINLPPFF